MLQLNHVLFGNTVIVWLASAVAALALMAALWLARSILLRRLAGLERWKGTLLERYVTALAVRIHPLVMAAVSLSLAAPIPTLPPGAARFFLLLGPLGLMAQAALWGSATIDFWLEAPFWRAPGRDRAAATRATVIGFILRVVLGSLVLLPALALLGFNITALLASLGIGGVAVALAMQNILGDLFASLSIALDRPFEVGDFIVIDAYMGTVEYVGLKTTRVRSLSGEQIIFANTDLLKSRIRNFKRMTDRRASFNLNVDYETSPEQLERIPEAIRRIIASRGRARFDRAHFKEFGEAALVFEVVYYILDPDMNLYMDLQQAINLDLHRWFRAEGIGFALPRCPLMLQAALKDSRSPLGQNRADHPIRSPAEGNPDAHP
jgi:small-conductance mechanosensitive channel